MVLFNKQKFKLQHFTCPNVHGQLTVELLNNYFPWSHCKKKPKYSSVFTKSKNWDQSMILPFYYLVCFLLWPIKVIIKSQSRQSIILYSIYVFLLRTYIVPLSTQPDSQFLTALKAEKLQRKCFVLDQRTVKYCISTLTHSLSKSSSSKSCLSLFLFNHILFHKL